MYISIEGNVLPSFFLTPTFLTLSAISVSTLNSGLH